MSNSIIENEKREEGDRLVQLQPCPFCGGRATIGCDGCSAGVYCLDCPAQIKVYPGEHSVSNQELAAKWNVRQGIAALLAACEELLRIVREQNGNLYDDINRIQVSAEAAIAKAQGERWSKS